MIENVFLARFADTLALVEVGRVVTFETMLLQAQAILGSTPEGRQALARISEPEAAASSDGGDDFWPAQGDWRAAYRPYTVKAGILQIPVQGVLLNNFTYQVGSYATGYDYIRKAFDRGMADPAVGGIAFMIDSPGGEVAGNFDLVDHMYAARGVKPIRSFAAEDAYSAAYSIASVGESISVTRSGGVGSIGVLTSHVDYSKYLEKQGLAITLISAPEGGYKTEGNPYEPLSADAKARIQARINELYSEFVSTVARNRGMDEKAVRDTKALTFSATQAIERGLADSISTLDDAMAAFAAEIKGGPVMADVKEADHLAALAAAKTSSDAALAAANTAAAEAAKAAVKADRERRQAILALDEAKDRPKLAAHLADSEMTAEQAKTILAAAAVEKPEGKNRADQQNRFNDAMRNGNPNLQNLGSDDDEDGEGEGNQGPEAKAEGILKNYYAFGGYVKGMGDDARADRGGRERRRN